MPGCYPGECLSFQAALAMLLQSRVGSDRGGVAEAEWQADKQVVTYRNYGVCGKRRSGLVRKACRQSIGFGARRSSLQQRRPEEAGTRSHVSMRYLISFDDGTMIFPEEDLPDVAAASRKVVADAKQAGVWIFG